MRTPVTLPDASRNPLSLVGMAIATAMAVVFVVLFVLQLLGYLVNPYVGLLVFVAVPLAFIFGLLLIPIGAWWSARRRLLHPEAAGWPVIDLRQPRQRSIAVAVIALTLVNLVIVSLASYGAVHHMESTAFCGQTCHTTMEPQAVAHRAFPHASVGCTQCHVGPGATAFLEAKMAGTRQLLQVMTNRVPKPVPPPEELIQGTNVACEQCHSRAARSADELRVIREYASDEANTETVTTLQMRIGSPDTSGIHRHIGLDIEYVATAPDTIPYVRVQEPGGGVREYVAEGTAADRFAGARRRRMDCMDCHNRPAHTFWSTPEKAVDAAMAAGRIPRELPFVRREAAAAVAAQYPDRASALDAIARRLNGFYRENGGEARLVERAVAGAQAVWATNVFPSMHVTWGTYPNHIGHIDTPGCFRCHDESHTAADGRVISQDCEMCHAMP